MTHPAEDPGHVPVLPDETAAVLDPKPGETVLDCTLGRGGHAALLLPRLSPGGTYIGLDVDPANLAFSRDRLAPLAAEHGVTLHLVEQNFRAAAGVLSDLRLPGVDGLLADLGFASNQVDDPERGLKFREDGPLDMRLGPSAVATAADLVNTLPEAELADVIYRYGEERNSRRIAKRIVAARAADGPIRTTGKLADLVRQAYPPGRHPRNARGRIDPATRTFQALRIAVNDELGALDDLLAALPGLLKPGGRAAIISFHSLEDRPVKQALLAHQQAGLGERLTRKPVTATDAEVYANARSRSAKLRAWRRNV